LQWLFGDQPTPEFAPTFAGEYQQPFGSLAGELRPLVAQPKLEASRNDEIAQSLERRGGADARIDPRALDGGGEGMNADEAGRSRLTSLSATEAEDVDRACDRFEEAWRAGEHPRIEDHPAGTTAPLRSVLLEELIAVELHWRRRCGEQPAQAEDHDRAAGVELPPKVADTGLTARGPALTPEGTFEAGLLGPWARQAAERAAPPADDITVGTPLADERAATAGSDTLSPVSTRITR
jgi:hypothetical protein